MCTERKATGLFVLADFLCDNGTAQTMPFLHDTALTIMICLPIYYIVYLTKYVKPLCTWGYKNSYIQVLQLTLKAPKDKLFDIFLDYTRLY